MLFNTMNNLCIGGFILSADLHKIYQMDFPETWMVVSTQNRPL